MEYRRLGRTGLQLSILSLGSWVTFHKQIDDNLVDRLMGIAYDNGINFFDNAESYARGESEKMMGRVLKQKYWERSAFNVSSKVFFGAHKENKPNQIGLSRKHIVEACHESLQRLQVEYLDLFFCHRPDPETPIEEVVWTMNILLQQGKILYWGTSEWSAQEIMEAHMVARENHLIGPAMEQPEYNLFNRRKVEVEFANIYRNIGLGTTIWSPLASGLLTGKYNNDVPPDSRLGLEGFQWLKDKTLVKEKIDKVKQLEKVADQLGTTLPILSIAWCIRNPNVTTAILGATKETQLTENLKAADLYPSLTLNIMEEIDLIMGNVSA
ncbi:aldo/keto reductase [Chitinophaga silvatica]|uniref:Aldo/keto reductase n=1 Tax=Chitinophaga silvatica TaxID=2282649 RepID=A0A3E1Y9S8_9BACT|nr:aldo/keto reductase [Chitinophaga silvatica]RFS22417.1 aldo/keto reductase [Chitinophaga silvatica]